MEIEVNGRAWEIVYVNPGNSNLKNSDGNYTLGVTVGYENRVYINRELTGPLLDKVLSHELCHVFCFSYNIWLDMKTEELIADFLATYGREIFDVADMVLGRFARIC